MSGKSSPFTLGVVGCGHIFFTVYAEVLKSLQGEVRVIAVCDPNSSAIGRALELFPEAKTFTNVGAMLGQESLDAVMVLIPEKFNAQVTVEILEKGIPVYLEKPPAISLLELEALKEIEKATGTPVYTAFNRRLTPMLREWKPPINLKRVRGLLERVGRRVDNFPYTAVHLIDAAQYFSGSLFSTAEVTFTNDRWQVQGLLKEGMSCELSIVPMGKAHEETLVFETPEGEWTLNFPNAAAKHSDGRLLFQACGHDRISEVEVPKLDILEAMGFVPVFRDFLSHLRESSWQGSPHRLSLCGPTIELMEKMFDAGRFGRPSSRHNL